MRSAFRNYYSQVIKKSKKLNTNTCYTIKIQSPQIKNILKNYHTSSLIIPDKLKNTKIMDLGYGTSKDIYILSQLVGENGRVVGIDNTGDELEKYNNNKEYLKEIFKKESNVTFIKGFIEELEELEELNLEKNSFDVILANCIINLNPYKEKLFNNVYNLLKPGGEFYFNDIYSSVRIPDELKNDSFLSGDYLSGSLYWNDFLNMVKKSGFIDPRLVGSKPIIIKNKEIEKMIGHIEFFSTTYRLFKIPDLLEPNCEDYGQVVVYKGGIENYENYWDLDNYHRMKKNKFTPVSGNTWNILYSSRFKSHFDFIGNSSQHFGIFDDGRRN